MKYYFSIIGLSTTFTVHGQANPATRARADSVYEAEVRAIEKRKHDIRASDSIATAKYMSTRKEELTTIDAKNGFRDLKFGISMSQVPGLVPHGKAIQSEQMYTRPADSKKVGGATLSAIYYTFYKGNLLAVTLETKGYLSSQALFKAFKSLYGEPEKPNLYIENYQWLGTKVVASFEQNSITDNGSIYLISKPISAQMTSDQEKTAKKAASDL